MFSLAFFSPVKHLELYLMPVIVTENLNCALSSVLGCGMLSHVLNVGIATYILHKFINTIFGILMTNMFCMISFTIVCTV